MGGEPAHRIRASLESKAGCVGGPLLGRENGPQAVQDGTEEHAARHGGSDTEEL